MKETYDYLIIGSGVAGYYALKELLKVSSASGIVMVTKDHYYPYDRPPLSKEYLRGEVDKGMLFFEKEEFYHRGNLRVILGKSIIKLLPNEKVAVLSDGTELGFNKALITTGGAPRRVELKGDANVHYLRTLDDADALKAKARSGKRVLIIGAGFIGVESAASFVMLGLKPTVIEFKPYIWSTLVDERISNIIHSYFAKRGVEFIVNDTVVELTQHGSSITAVTRNGRSINADFALAAIGITPSVELAKDAGLTVDNGIVVNQYLQTSNPDIYAAGDVANIPDPKRGRMRIEHWNNAEYTGRLAARNMAGKQEPYNFLSTVWSDIFDLHIESAGDTMNYTDYAIRGKLEESPPSYSIIYLRDNLVVGYVAVNRSGNELKALNSMVMKELDLSGKRGVLTDESYELNSLVQDN